MVNCNSQQDLMTNGKEVETYSFRRYFRFAGKNIVKDLKQNKSLENDGIAEKLFKNGTISCTIKWTHLCEGIP